MKKLITFTAAGIFVGSCAVLRAQEQPDQAQIPIEPPPLIPAPPLPAPNAGESRGPAIPDLSQLDAFFKQSPIGQAAVDYKLHVEWRKLQNRVANEPEIIAAKAAAEEASTDLEKRARLRVHYEKYYARMRALATPEMRTYLDARLAEYRRMLQQPHVRPAR